MANRFENRPYNQLYDIAENLRPGQKLNPRFLGDIAKYSRKKQEAILARLGNKPSPEQVPYQRYNDDR